MKTYYCKNFKGHWPVGVCGIVVAPHRVAAAAALSAKLKEDGLEQTIDPIEMIHVDSALAQVIIVNNGGY